MSLTGILLGLINIAIVVAILLLIGAIIEWFLGSIIKMPITLTVRNAYLAVVALIALYMLVALILGAPALRIIGP